MSFHEADGQHNTRSVNNSCTPLLCMGGNLITKNAEEKNNTRLKSLKVIEAMFCDSIKKGNIKKRKNAGEETGCRKKQNRDGR